MKNNRNVKKYLCILFLIPILLAGCSSTVDEKSGENATSHKPIIFGATYMTLNNPFFRVLNDSIKEVIEANGDILITRDPAQDPKKQTEEIAEMIKENVKIIFVNPVKRDTITSALEACKKAGVIVINVDTLVEKQDDVISAVESDNYNAGVICAQDLMKKKQHAKIVILNSPVLDSITKRVQGFTDTLVDYPNYVVVHTESTGAEFEVAMEVMSHILETNFEFDVVFAGNDPTALGALAALQQRHKEKDVMIYGVDGSPDAKMMIAEGYIEASASQSPKTMGAKAAEIAYAFLRGEPIEKHIEIPGPLITKNNLNQFDIDGWQ
jgi:ribose transport system substrate-binding protein